MPLHRSKAANSRRSPSRKHNPKSPLQLLEIDRIGLRKKIVNGRKEEEKLGRKIDQLRTRIANKRKSMGNYRSMMSLEQAFERKRMGQKKFKTLTNEQQFFTGAAIGRTNVCRENKLMLDKAMRRLRQRIANMLVNINEERKKNRELKQLVNDLRQERLVFNGVFTRLEQELEKEKGRVDSSKAIIEAAYVNRDKAQTLMRELSHDFTEEKNAWLKEWRELGAQLGASKPLQEAKTMGSTDDFKLGQLTVQEEEQLKSSLWKKLWGMGRSKITNSVDAKHLTELRASARRMKEATGVSSLDELIGAFVEMEDANYHKLRTTSQKTKMLQEVQEDLERARAEKAEILKEKVLATESRQSLQIKLERQIKSLTEIRNAAECETAQNLEYIERTCPLVQVNLMKIIISTACKADFFLWFICYFGVFDSILSAYALYVSLVMCDLVVFPILSPPPRQPTFYLLLYFMRMICCFVRWFGSMTSPGPLRWAGVRNSGRLYVPE